MLVGGGRHTAQMPSTSRWLSWRAPNSCGALLAAVNSFWYSSRSSGSAACSNHHHVTLTPRQGATHVQVPVSS